MKCNGICSMCKKHKVVDNSVVKENLTTESIEGYELTRNIFGKEIVRKVKNADVKRIGS